MSIPNGRPPESKVRRVTGGLKVDTAALRAGQ
jgi:hypothetical protein